MARLHWSWRDLRAVLVEIWSSGGAGGLFLLMNITDLNFFAAAKGRVTPVGEVLLVSLCQPRFSCCGSRVGCWELPDQRRQVYPHVFCPLILFKDIYKHCLHVPFPGMVSPWESCASEYGNWRHVPLWIKERWLLYCRWQGRESTVEILGEGIQAALSTYDSCLGIHP